MKKAIVLLLALAVLGSAAFAQELKFSGYLDTGVAYFDDGTNDPTIGLWGDDSGTTTRLNFQGAYTNQNVGATFRLRMQNVDTGSPAATPAHSAVFVNRAWVWATMFDGMAKLQVGKLGDYTWSSFGNDFGNFDTATGLQLQIMPVAGLNFGFFLPADGTVAQRALAEDAFGDIALGASYALDGIGAFRAGFDLSPIDDSNMAYFSAKITAVEGFEFLFDAQLKDIGNDVTGYTYLYQGIDYTKDALNVGIDLEQTIYADDAQEILLAFAPYISYDLGMFIPGFAFEYSMQDDLNGMYFNPYVKYNVGPKAVIELGGKVNTGDFSEASRYYAAFTWSF